MMWLLRRLFGGKKSSSRKIVYRSQGTDMPGLNQAMIDRNEKAHQLERAGEIKKAIKLYERSVQQNFIGSFPYTRLRIIYTKQKRYDDAIRVCQSFVDNPHLTGGNKTKGRAEFQRWIRKLEKKL